jgi:hypothetical protein
MTRDSRSKECTIKALAIAGSLLLPFLMTACSDVGDNSAVNEDSGSTEDATTGEDAAETSTGNVDSAAQDSTVIGEDTGVAEDSGAPTDTGAPDSGEPVDSSAPVDSGPLDSGEPVDSSAPVDSGPLDSGEPVDSSAPVDSGPLDSGVPDANDAGEIDSSAPAEAGADGNSPALVPCTAASQTDCVQCQGSTGGVCTPTEAAFVQYDITQGYATAPGADGPNACYTCLISKLALDATSNPLSGDLECGDLTGTGDTGPEDCMATLNCIIASSCATVAANVCYCGTEPVSSTCSTSGGNGVCAAQEAAGLGLPVTSGQSILENYLSQTLSSGIANNIFQTALSNQCTTCP